MIKEAYCSKEVSKLLKEKGFNESCYTYYDDIDDSINRFDKGYHFNNTSYPWGVPYDISKAKKYVVAPTHQMAMRWLRERKIYIMIDRSWSMADSWQYCICVNNDFDNLIQQTSVPNRTYEEAVEAAIKYCLENLIYDS